MLPSSPPSAKPARPPIIPPNQPPRAGCGVDVGDVGELSERDGGTALQFSFRAIGAIDAGFRERAAEGWAELIGRLKTLVETGARLGIAPDPPHKEKKR